MVFAFIPITRPFSRWLTICTHIPHLQKSTSTITCSCLQRVIAVFGHLRVIGAYLEKCTIDNSAVSTDYCLSQTGVPSESNRAFVVIEHSLLQVNHPQRSGREENTQEPGKGCGMWVCRYCHCALGRFLVGGRPLPLYSGTSPHTSTIASSYPPHPSETIGGGECRCPRLFSCLKASTAASVSLLAIPRAALRRVSLSISVQRKNSQISA